MDIVKISYQDDASPLPEEIERWVVNQIEIIVAALNAPKGFFEIYFCSTETIRSLNLQYRHVDKPTDVLSWSYINQTEADDRVGDGVPWGELAICLEIVREQAIAFNWELSTELLRLIVHGLMHLMGLDHVTKADEEKMLGREVEMLSLIGLGDIYTL